jgi:pimeloyl-ACP methyl ester carboxylesterase
MEDQFPFASDTRFAEIPGARLAYDEEGSGVPLVFLHGGLLDRRQWDSQFAFFARDHRVIRYDMRSASQSDTAPSNEPFTHHKDLLQLLRALNIDCVSLVGLSNYTVALDFTITYPKMVEKLVLVSPGLRGYEPHDPWIGNGFAALRSALGRGDLNGAVEVFLSMWVDGPYRTPAEVSPAVGDCAREMATRAFQMSRLAPNCKGLKPPAIGRLAEVQVPTLVVLGEKDALDIDAMGHLIHKGIGGARLVEISDVGHTLVMERPDEFNRVVEDFLAH